MHDVACEFWMRGKDAQKQLARTSEHSFRARSYSCDSARAQGFKNNKHAVDTAIILFTQCPHCLCYFFSIIERSVLIVLIFYCKDMLQKVTMQRIQQFPAFSLLPKEPR